jgi:hypothetical protein
MTYIPPLNGGRINATISGNTAGAGALVSTGTLTLAGGNNITLSQAGNAVTISGPNAAAAASNTLGMSNLGNTSGTTGVISGSALRFAFAGGDNVTLSQSLNASSGTITISAADQTLQTQNLHNLTLSGNTAGAMAQVSSGTLTLAGGNNITLSQAGNAVTISGPSTVAAGSNTFGMSNIGNTSGTTGVVSGSGVRFAFAGGNNITLSQSINGSSGTITVSAASQSVQTQGLQNITFSGNTAGAMANVSSGALTMAGGNNITMSQAGNAVTLSGANQTAQTQSNIQAIYDGAASISTGTIRYSNLNGISFGINGQTLTASHNGLTSQSLQTQGLQNITLSGNTAGAMANVSSGAMTLAGGNNITLSQAGNAVTVSAAAQSVQTQNMVSVGGSTGNITFSNANNITFGGNASTITASASFNQTNQSMGVYAVSNTTGGATSGTADARSLSFQGAGGVSVGYSNGSVQISGAAGGGGGGVSAIGADTLTTYTSGSVGIMDAGGAITISTAAGQKINISVPATSSLSATGGVNISSNGATISIGAQAPVTLSRWEYPNQGFTSLGQNGQGWLSIQPMYVPFNITGGTMKIGGSMSLGSTTNVTTASANVSLWMGIYTLNGSTLSLASSGSANNGFSWQPASTTGYSSITGMRQMTVPMTVNMTPGQYWVGAIVSSATTFTGGTFNMYGNNQVASAASNAVLTPIGSGTTAARDVMLLQGIYTSTASSGPATMVGSQINNTSVSFVQRANFYNAIINAVY